MENKLLFRDRHGVIPACDVHTIEDFGKIIQNTESIEGIVGYKIGCVLSLKYGLSKLTSLTKDYTDLPIIYDHQKAGTDIPQMGEQFAITCKEGRVKGVIIFPQAGPASEEAFIKALLQQNLVPIVGGEMTHPKYLEKEGGFIKNNSPEKMYKIGEENDVTHFVIPGNRVDSIKKYYDLLSSIVKEVRFLMPGIGRQGGDIQSAFKAVSESSAYAIIGSGIYKAKNMVKAARIFCKEALLFD